MKAFSQIVGLAIFIHVIAATAQDGVPQFVDGTEAARVAFHHQSPMSPERHLHLTMGSGVAVLDIDGDCWPDIYFVQGSEWTGSVVGTEDCRDVVLRNYTGRFSDISAITDVASGGYGMGASVLDFNGDGFSDLYVSRLGVDHLMLNNGDGTLSDAAVRLPESTMSYSAGSTAIDIEGDGDPDLMVTRYVEVTDDNYLTCTDAASGLAIACPPREMQGLQDVLLLNTADGFLKDISDQRGFPRVKPAQGLGAVSCDFDDDGDFDLYVANDSVSNHFWRNDGFGQFVEDGLLTGTALNRDGLREAGMGIAIGDMTSNGRVDMLVTNFQDETNTLYRNEGHGLFLDVSDEIGVGAPSRKHLAFGVNVFDADGDTDLDLFLANGHIHDQLRDLGRDTEYFQSAQVLEMRRKRYFDVSQSAGKVFSNHYLGRGSATLDFDRDGRTDVMMANLGGNPILFHNQTPGHGEVAVFRVRGTEACRETAGVRVTAKTGSGKLLVRVVPGSGSYLSSNESVVRFGLGEADYIREVDVQWIPGPSQKWTQFQDDAEHCLVQGVPAAFSMP